MRLALLLVGAAVFAQTGAQAPFSRQYLEVKQYSDAENQEIVKKFADLRVTDVVDGLDVVGLQDVTVMDGGIAPMWRTLVRSPRRAATAAELRRQFATSWNAFAGFAYSYVKVGQYRGRD